MAILSMVKSYSELIGIFRGKQAEYNSCILTILFDTGPLTAWEITGKIRNQGKVSLHATLNKRLRDLEKKDYIQKEGKLWLLQFKGMIATLIIQKQPKPWNVKWTKIVEQYSNKLKKTDAFFGAKVQIDNIQINQTKIIEQSIEAVKQLDNWVLLADNVKNLMQTGVVNLDLINNRTLLTVILSQASKDDLEKVLEEWKNKK
jgi:hypothetical protein